MTSYSKKIPVSLLLLAGLSACGGGSSSSSSSSPDTTAPVLTLTGDLDVNIEVLTPFIDPGSSALDDRDGAVPVTVTGSVDTGVLGAYELLYSAVDKAGNTSTATRTFNVIDSTAPVVSLMSDASFTMQVGDEYREFGATVSDNFDTELSLSLVSNVDTSTAGEYEIVYSSMDASGNEGSATRLVTVLPRSLTITIDKFGEGDVVVQQGPDLDCSVGFDCVAVVGQDEVVVLEATATAPWVFVSWRGCDDVEGVTETQCSVSADSDRVVSLTFSPNDRGYEYELAAGAFELDDTFKSKILDYDAASGVITFKSDVDIDSIPVGTVIASSGVVNTSGVRENYFLRRVEEIIGDDRSLKVFKTSDATVTDLVKDGTFVWQEVLTSDDVNESLLPEGLTLVKSRNAKSSAKADNPIEFFASNLVLYDGDGSLATKEDQITFTGGIKVGVNPDFALDVDYPATVNEFRSIAYVDFSTEAGVDIGNTVEISQKTLKVISVSFAAIPLGPVVLVPSVDLNIVYRAGVGGAIKPRAVASTRMVAGARYSSNKGWDGVSDFDYALSVNDWASSIDFKAHAEVGPEMEFATRLYGVTGPTISAKTVIGVEALVDFKSADCDIDVNSFFEAAASFGADFRLLTKRFDYTVDLIKYKRIVESLSRECGSGELTAPNDLVVTPVSEQSLSLEWGMVGTGSEITYKVVRDGVGIASDVLSSDYVDASLTVGTEYCYEVIAVDDLGVESIPSNKACALVSGEDTESPTEPLSLVAMPLSSTGINLSWTASEDNVGVTGYTVYAFEAGDVSRPLDVVADISYDVLRLSPGVEYCFTVSAYDAEGNISDISAPVCATTLPAEEAKWNMFIKCTSRDTYVVEDIFDLDEEYTSSVFVFGTSQDYGGTDMYYNLFGIYDDTTSIFSGEISWTFAGSSNLRKDAFSADLSLNDTGDIEMDQLKVTGCDASIKFVNLETAPESQKSKSKVVDHGEGNISSF